MGPSSKRCARSHYLTNWALSLQTATYLCVTVF
ncbi:hypothetical protein PHMEG_00025694 [Phytophthora megakarya]|uniref:Uncharacterized protein n=1 Tax=Phytophthora megakarya TaxID=4795 RepID=A0A225VDZ8_9STRA|nr:hypothetical protein PHMEG_00025694 [Phytophthora megakarya]